MYGDVFLEWTKPKQEQIEQILDQGSKDSSVYMILNSKFDEILKKEDNINIQTLVDFLKLENQDGKEDKSYRESVLYYIVTAVTNSQCNSANEKEIQSWIQNIDNLSSLFGFSNDHCYLFTLIYTLETEEKLQLFSKLNEEIFLHIIHDKDFLPSDLDDGGKKNKLIYYLMNLLVKSKNYTAAYRFYNAFIDEDVQETEVQIDIIKTLTSEASLVSSFNFFRKSGDEMLEKKLEAMLELSNSKYRINELIHLPFNQKEIDKIKEIAQKNTELYSELEKLFDDVR